MALSVDRRIRLWLHKTHGFWFSLYVAGFAFCLYTCIYAFRKTFSVALFEEDPVFGISFKVWLIIAQVLGYALSKFMGISFVSELETHRRSQYIFVFSGIAILSWLFFALTPVPYNIPFLFINGLNLGMMWGILFSYLEGRRCTEVLAAGLSASFIFSSGFVKSVGEFTMTQWGTSEYWMPFVTSLLFVIPVFLFTWLMERIPTPCHADIKARSQRVPMDKKQRWAFVLSFWPGIILFIAAYLLLTAFRDFRDNFVAEVWNQLGEAHSSSIYTLTEIPITVVVLVTVGLTMYIRQNQTAFAVSHLLIIIGFATIGCSTWLFETGVLPATGWMILVGLGLYLGYVPFNSIFFERMLASFKYVGTSGFIMYLSDSIGYLGSISVLIFKEIAYQKLSWLEFFVQSSYFLGVTGSVLMTSSLIYFVVRQRNWKPSRERMAAPVATSAPL